MYCSAIGESAGHVTVYVKQPTPPPQTLPSSEPEPETEPEPTPNILDTVFSASTVMSLVTTIAYALILNLKHGAGDISNLHLTESSPLHHL